MKAYVKFRIMTDGRIFALQRKRNRFMGIWTSVLKYSVLLEQSEMATFSSEEEVRVWIKENYGASANIEDNAWRVL